MAKKGGIKRMEENAARMKRILYITMVAGGVYGVVRLLLRGGMADSFLFWSYLGTMALLGTCYSTMAAIGAPTITGTGEVLDGGADMSKGMAQYLADIVYLSSFTLVLGCLTDRAWWLMTLIPAYASVVFFQKVVVPWWNSPDPSAPVNLSAEDQKRAERAQKRSERRRMKRI